MPVRDPDLDTGLLELGVWKPKSAEAVALRGAIDSLPSDEKHELSDEMLLGRGDFGTFDDALAYTKDFNPETTGLYLFGKTLALDRYLQHGMERLAGTYSGNDFADSEDTDEETPDDVR